MGVYGKSSFPFFYQGKNKKRRMTMEIATGQWPLVMVRQNKKGENEAPPFCLPCNCEAYFAGAGVSCFVSVVFDMVFFVFLAPLFLVLVFVVLVVVSFFSGVVVVVVVVFSDVPAGAWANVPVANATLINTASANINTFFMSFLLFGIVFYICYLQSILHYICH